MYLPTERNWKDWRPYAKWVFVRADKRVKKTAGGIIIPDSGVAVERVMEGTGCVLKVGSEVRDALGVGIEPGMRICYRGFLKDAFHEFAEDDGCRVFMLRAEDVMAIIDDDVQMGEFVGTTEA